jgi:hypothetical protein
MAETGVAGGAAGQPTADAGTGDAGQAKSDEVTQADASGGEGAKERDSTGRFRAKLKVDGAEEEVDLSQEEVTTRLQKQRFYEKREKEFRTQQAELEKAKRALQEFAQRPEAYLEELLGQERLDALLQQRLAQAAKQAAMTPEQLELERMRHEHKRLQEQLQQREQSEQQQMQDAAVEQLLEQAQPRIVAAMEAAGLPRVPAVIRDYADTALRALEQGRVLSEQDIAQHLAKKYDAIARHYRDLTAAKDPDAYINWMGEEQFRKLSEHRVARAKAAQGPSRKAPAQQETKQNGEDAGYIDEAEFRRRAGLR